MAGIAKARGHVLALDLDGVLYHHPRVARVVANRCVRYVADELRISPAEAEPLNALLYREYGHTLRGLNEMFGGARTLQHFNARVYDEATLDCVRRHALDPGHVSRAQDARDALRRCRAAALDVYVFSNAPAVWCEAALGAMGFLDRLVPRSHVVSSDHPALKGTSKPLSGAYKGFAEVAGVGSHGGRAATFVDDTVGNLLPLLHAPAWTPVLYSQSGDGTMPPLPQRVLHERTRLRQVRSLAEAVDGVLLAASSHR